MKYGEPVKHFWRGLSGRERRKAERRAIPGLVAYYWDGGAPVAHSVRNISLTGMYLLTGQRWYPGTVMTMRLQQMDSADADPDHSIAVHARVVRSDIDGVSLAFISPVASRSTDGGKDAKNNAVDKKALDRFMRRWFLEGRS